MQLTQKDMLTLLKQSGREGWTLRQMTALREGGWLPPLRRQTQPGTNKRLYVWGEQDIEQIVEVYDWWSYCHGDRATLTLALWLQGYEVPLDLLRRLYLRIIEGYLQRLTRGKTDPDDVLDEVSKIVVTLSRKFRYSPGLATQRKQMSIEQMELVTEMMLGALAVPDPEQTAETFRSVLLGVGESLGASKAAASSEPPSLPKWFTTNLTLTGACWLIAPFLSARYRGYGQLLDMAFEKIHEMLTGPSFRAQALQLQKERARRTIEADVNDIPLVS